VIRPFDDRPAPHRVAGVEQKVQRDLLQLHRIGEQRRAVARQSGVRDPPLDGIAVEERQDLRDHLAEVDLPGLHVTLPEQRAAC
jgi:hypothetical protein